MKSPLRYPGGKTRARKIIDEFVPRNKTVLLSPFFGGGSYELFRGGTWFANDLFFPLYSFWDSLKNDKDSLIQDVQSKRPVTRDTFKHMRSKSYITPSEYFAINRCSFSGSTFCGGFSQESATCRFTDSSIKTLEKIDLSEFTFSNLDAIEFLKSHPETSDTWIYADPPYYIETYIYGRHGDLHENFKHKEFAEYIQTRSDWTLSYNDCEYIRELYSSCTFHEVSWSYGMNALKKSSEVIITPVI